MSKRRSGSYGHRTQILGWDHVRLFWVVDYKHEGSRLRYPRTFSRDTDMDGAQRYIKRWRIANEGVRP